MRELFDLLAGIDSNTLLESRNLSAPSRQDAQPKVITPTRIDCKPRGILAEIMAEVPERHALDDFDAEGSTKNPLYTSVTLSNRL